jgi:hypothetical protein
MRRLVVGIMALLAGVAIVFVAPDMGTASCVAAPGGTQFCETAFQTHVNVIAVSFVGLFAVAAGGRIVWTELI